MREFWIQLPPLSGFVGRWFNQQKTDSISSCQVLIHTKLYFINKKWNFVRKHAIWYDSPTQTRIPLEISWVTRMRIQPKLGRNRVASPVWVSPWQAAYSTRMTVYCMCTAPRSMLKNLQQHSERITIHIGKHPTVKHNLETTFLCILKFHAVETINK